MKSRFSDPEKERELYELLYSRQEMPFHKGEVAVQKRAGEELIGLSNGKIISDSISPAVAQFIATLPFAIICTQDKDGQLWVSVLCFESGYFNFPDEKTLLLHQDKLLSNPLDDFSKRLTHHPYMGILFVDPFTRKRYRINGWAGILENKIKLDVEQAFVNCPKYIQKRKISLKEKGVKFSSEKQEGTYLNNQLKEWISSSDTFFVGSSDDEGKLDASHRGGKAGFVLVQDYKTLQIPDYVGNSMYNTLGNFEVNPKAGLLFIDFKNHLTLQLSGATEIMWDSPEEELLPGIRRYWRFHISSWVVMENVKDLEGEFMEFSPFNPA